MNDNLLFINMNIRNIIKEEVKKFSINEKLDYVDNDVNYLYDTYFKNDIENIKQYGHINQTMFKKATSSTNMLKDEISKKSHELNPCVININHGLNGYDPNKKIIYLSVNYDALNLVLNHDGYIDKALSDVEAHKHDQFRNEFTEHKINGSIHHELLHWIDDTNHNQPIKRVINRAMEYGRDTVLKGKDINTTKFEIQGQMGNISQIKNNVGNKVWNEMSFADMIKKSPALSSIYRNLKPNERTEWLKNLKKRMNRENLLGNNMR